MSKKINLDKYYTNKELAKYCFEKTIKIIGKDNITEYLEPSAGSGVFLEFFDKPYVALDLEPEAENILKQDYFDFPDDYKQGRLTIGNPPFGKAGNLAIQFTIKSLKNSDYTAFIMPIGFHNSKSIKGLIYSEDLGIKEYSGRLIHCCLNIYSKQKAESEKITEQHIDKMEVIRYQRRQANNKKPFDKEKYCLSKFDYAFVAVGDLGKQITYNDQLCSYILLKFHNQDIKEKVMKIIKRTNFKDKSIFKYSTIPTLGKNNFIKYLKKELDKET